MTSAPPLLSSMALLPALSVVLGMPLCTGNRSDDVVLSIPGFLAVSSNKSGDHDRCGHAQNDNNNHNRRQTCPRPHDPQQSSPPEPRGRRSQDAKFAKRAKDNVSRIYVRRMMIKAHNDQPLVENENGWRDDVKRTLLSEALLSLLQLKHRRERATELFNGSNTNHDKKDDHEANSPSPFRISFGDSNNDKYGHRNVLPVHFHRQMAMCESSQQRTLDEYNALSSASSPSLDELKPAEWNKDVDLARRRLEFGEKISPLSNTTRLERWTMAVKRMVALGALAAPIGVMVPGIWALGGLVGDYDDDEDMDDEERTGGGEKRSSQHLSLLQRCHRSLTQRTWSYALWAVEQAGPTYIKLVQWASTRNDLFSPEFVGHFSKLQDETRGHSWKDTEVALEKAFGKDWRGILSFDKVIEDEYEGGVDGGMRGVGSSANKERQRRMGQRETSNKGGGVGKGKMSGSRKEDLPTVPIGSGCVAQGE
ncbi:hypothetical protein ACHAXS_002626 [Conticribra weissflogii]